MSFAAGLQRVIAEMLASEAQKLKGTQTMQGHLYIEFNIHKELLNLGFRVHTGLGTPEHTRSA